ncbi:xaa-Pro aminopeptidase 2-like [Saccostrea cucullata]|uniref:xaa-Pro aminopeptidase 2-like n=1 Tax=Saccostrea cuccullata TaxID=36930 RepID=UPI002ED4EB79
MWFRFQVFFQVKSTRLNDLRKLMQENHINAYIVCNVNENLGKLTSHDRRLEALSGFSGLIGTAVVTLDSAALWTDGRTFQTAIDDVTCGWSVFRKGGKETTSLVDWIYEHVENPISVGASPYLFSAVWWNNFQKIFEVKNTTFVPMYTDLIDLVWTEDRPPLPTSPIHILPPQISGETWQSKIERTLHIMKEKNADILVLTNLGEIAWLFNLRARDFAYDPYFISFCIISARTGIISLYMVEAEKKLTENLETVDIKLFEFLNSSKSGECLKRNCYQDINIYRDDSMETCDKKDENLIEKGYCIEVKEYSPQNLKDVIGNLSRDEHVRKVWVSWDCSQAFITEIPKEKLLIEYTPPLMFKAVKNSAEIEAMKTSTLRDSVFLITYFAGLDERINKGEVLKINDIEAESKKLRKNELFNKGPSGISLIGTGSATSALRPKVTDDIIGKNDVFLFDIGAHYLDGTTDIARSFVFGTPTEKQKDIYTRLLMTQINLAKKKFSIGSTGRDLDTADVRKPLRDVGVDFPHEIGHMIAVYGSIIEGPASISNISEDWSSNVPMDRHIFDCKTCKKSQDLMSPPDGRDYVLEEGMIFSNEPSFYSEGEFGMRLENTMFITKADGGKHCYAFEQLVLIPYEFNLIKTELLSTEQISWLKDYYKTVDKLVTPHLEAKNDSVALKWFKDRINADFLSNI